MKNRKFWKKVYKYTFPTNHNNWRHIRATKDKVIFITALLRDGLYISIFICALIDVLFYNVDSLKSMYIQMMSFTILILLLYLIVGKMVSNFVGVDRQFKYHEILDSREKSSA